MVNSRWGRRWRQRRLDSKAGIHRKEEKKKNRLHTHRPSHGSCRLPSNWRRATIDPRTSNKKTNRSEPPLPSSTGISLILNASASSASRRRRVFVIFNLRYWEKICRSERIQTCLLGSPLTLKFEVVPPKGGAAFFTTSFSLTRVSLLFLLFHRSTSNA